MARRGGSKQRTQTAGADAAVVWTGLEHIASKANVVALGVAAEVLREIIRPAFDHLVATAPRNTGGFVAGLRYTDTKHGGKASSRREYTRWVSWPGKIKPVHMYPWWAFANEVTYGAEQGADEVAERIIEALDNAS